MKRNNVNSADGSSIIVKRRLIMSLILLLLISSFSVLLVMKGNRLIEIKTVKIELEQELEKTNEYEVSLRREIKKLEDPEYVAGLARRDYYLSKEEEYIFRSN